MQSHRIHGAAIYANIYHQYTPVMLAYRAAPWMLWGIQWIQWPIELDEIRRLAEFLQNELVFQFANYSFVITGLRITMNMKITRSLS